VRAPEEMVALETGRTMRLKPAEINMVLVLQVEPTNPNEVVPLLAPLLVPTAAQCAPTASRSVGVLNVVLATDKPVNASVETDGQVARALAEMESQEMLRMASDRCDALFVLTDAVNVVVLTVALATDKQANASARATGVVERAATKAESSEPDTHVLAPTEQTLTIPTLSAPPMLTLPCGRLSLECCPQFV